MLNSKYQLLLPRRGAHMKTCPSTLSIIGEHNDPEDKDWETAVRRGLREEIKVPQDIADMPLHPLSLVTFRHQYANGRTDVQLSWRGYVVYHRPLEFATMDRSEVDAADVKGKFYDLAVVCRPCRPKEGDEHAGACLVGRALFKNSAPLGGVPHHPPTPNLSYSRSLFKLSLGWCGKYGVLLETWALLYLGSSPLQNLFISRVRPQILLHCV